MTFYNLPILSARQTQKSLLLVLLVFLAAWFGRDAMAQDLPAMEDRLREISGQFLGKAYLASPLGEGQGIDPDPLIRFDAFDCTTYVETVMAMSLSRSKQDVLPILNHIRYSKGQVDFNSRRHLPAFQWLDELTDKQVLMDVTAGLGHDIAYLEQQISPYAWSNRQWRIVPQLPASSIPSKKLQLPYIPLHNILPALGDFSQPAVLSVVKFPRDDAPILVSHHALLFHIDDQKRVRHASPDKNAVVEESLESFVKRLQRQRYWPVAGLNVAVLSGRMPF